MYEDSVSTFVKAREQLLLSILDGLDVEESIEEYVIAKAVMEQDGFINDITWKENICDSFVRKMSGGYIPREQYLAIQAEQNQQHLSKEQPWRGRVRRRGASHHHDLEVADIGLVAYGDSQSNRVDGQADATHAHQPQDTRKDISSGGACTRQDAQEEGQPTSQGNGEVGPRGQHGQELPRSRSSRWSERCIAQDHARRVREGLPTLAQW